MRLNTIPNYLDQALTSKVGGWVGTAPFIVTIIAGASCLSKSLKTSTLPTTIICTVAAIAGPALMLKIANTDFGFSHIYKGDSKQTIRWKERFTILTSATALIIPLIIGGAALKYLAPHSSIIVNSAFLFSNLSAATILVIISQKFFEGKLN